MTKTIGIVGDTDSHKSTVRKIFKNLCTERNPTAEAFSFAELVPPFDIVWREEFDLIIAIIDWSSEHSIVSEEADYIIYTCPSDPPGTLEREVERILSKIKKNFARRELC